MKQQWQKVRSKKEVDKDAVFKFKLTPGVKHKDVYLCAFDATKKSMYTDQTVCFYIMSSE